MPTPEEYERLHTQLRRQLAEARRAEYQRPVMVEPPRTLLRTTVLAALCALLTVLVGIRAAQWWAPALPTSGELTRTALAPIVISPSRLLSDTATARLVAVDLNCQMRIVERIRDHFHYDPASDGPHFGVATASATVVLSAGRLLDTQTFLDQPAGLHRELLSAISAAADLGAFLEPGCDAPTGTLTVFARTARDPGGGWRGQVELGGSRLGLPSVAGTAARH